MYALFEKMVFFLVENLILQVFFGRMAKKNKNFCVEIHCFTLEIEIFFQFFFGDLKKRRIFALAFKETSTVDKKAV